MEFEKFVSQFVKSVDDMDKQGRGVHNSDIVELIWNNMMNHKLRQYITAIKLQFQHLPRPYKQVLQYIASQVLFLATTNFFQTSEISTTLEIQQKEIFLRLEHMTSKGISSS